MPSKPPPTLDEALPVVERNLARVRERIARACETAGRDAGAVSLLPVTKYAPDVAVRALHALGVGQVGESTVQETLRKRDALAEIADALRWHLVGHLQRNKARRAVELFETIHSLDSWRLAETLDRRLADRPEKPRLYVEVNVGGEASKSGLAPDDLLAFLERLRDETRLGSTLEGLMTVAPREPSVERARAHFARLAALRDTACDRGLLPPHAGLSMGMSGDLEAAVAEGSTVLRVGSSLFEGLPTGR